MIWKKYFWGVLLYILLSSSPAPGQHSHSSSPREGQAHQQGSGTKNHEHAQGSGCNIDVGSGWLGLEVDVLDQNAGSNGDNEVIVRRVISGGPAEKVGIKAGDILITLDGEFLKSVEQLENSIMGFQIGYNAYLGVKRGNQKLQVVIKIDKKPSGSPFGMMPMMPGGGGGMSEMAGMSGGARPGMFFEDMMKRSPLGQMQNSGMKPGPAMVFGNTGQSESSETNRMYKSPPDEPGQRRHKFDVINRYILHEKELNLSPGQIKALKNIKRNIEKTMIRLNASIEIAQIEMDELLNESQMDMEKMDKKIREIENHRTDRSLEQIRSIQEARKILSKKQQEQFKALSGNF